MTPAASNVAERTARAKRAALTGHRRRVRTSPATRTPRRVSGPIQGRAASAPGHKTAARAAAVIRSLPDHRLLDRIVRGRAWIPLLGVMLAGIVAMQVEQLKLGASIGRSIQRSAALESRNELLRTSVAALADDQRIERLAAGMGMIMPPPEAIGFLSAKPDGDATKAAADIHAPDTSGVLSLMSSNGAVVTGSSGSGTTDSQSAQSTTSSGASGTAGSISTPSHTAAATQAVTPIHSSSQTTGG